MSVNLSTPVQYLKGVGPKLGQLLGKRGVENIGDLLEFYPRTYEDRRAMRQIADLQPEQRVQVRVQVIKVRSQNLGRTRRKMYEVLVGDSSGRIACKFFRVPYRGYFERFSEQSLVKVTGKVVDYRGKLEFHHPTIEPVLPDEDESDEDLIIPIYTEIETISSSKMQKLVENAFKQLDEGVKEQRAKEFETGYKFNSIPGFVDAVPKWIREKYSLMDRRQALKQVHLPDIKQAEALLELRSPAHQRLIFDEFFGLELFLASRKTEVQKKAAPKMSAKFQLVDELKRSLPFELTGAQKKSFEEIAQDLQKGHPMHRLVQGDVGSGKTLVSLLAACFACENGYQSSIMVPTEILAEQHYINAKKYLEPLGVRVGYIVGGMKAKEKQEVYEKIAAGEIDLCVGTHALIQKDVAFKKLALVIIDEQHRFGVQQRAELMDKGLSPHFLVMTATPIPRTLAMTVYGDLDVSVINELPKGRQPIVTRKTFSSKKDKVLQFLNDQIAKGRQAYIVYPLVEESEKMDLKNAVDEHKKLVEQYPNLRVGLLHGKMKPAEKEQVMKLFRDHQLDVLVSTTVIEVGVDVPTANLMIIEHAERFGLSQLHQLRGRVGRGEHKSYCVLVLGYAVGEDGQKRAEIMEQHSDGFKIAEKDLEIRGPGEFLGTRQSGLAGFKLANLVRDLDLLQLARKAAFDVVEKDPDLKDPEHIHLKQALERHRMRVIG